MINANRLSRHTTQSNNKKSSFMPVRWTVDRYNKKNIDFTLFYIIIM